MAKFVIILLSLMSFCQAIQLNINNNSNRTLVLGFSPTDVLNSGLTITRVLPIGFIQTISVKTANNRLAAASARGITEGYTKVYINVGALGTYTAIDVTDGYNVGATIGGTTSLGTSCSTSSCVIDLDTQCPLAYQVLNSAGDIVSCLNNNPIMLTACPTASTILSDVTNTCLLANQLTLTLS